MALGSEVISEWNGLCPVFKMQAVSFPPPILCMAFGLFLETVVFAVPMKLENWFQILGIEMPRKKKPK